jgi:hypothetical protein
MGYIAKLTEHARQKPAQFAVAVAVLAVLTVIMIVRARGAYMDMMSCKKPMPGPIVKRGRRMRRVQRPMKRGDAFMAGDLNVEAESDAADKVPFDWSKPVCVMPWDPAAVEESQALAQIGSLEVDDYGEKALERAADGATSVRGTPTNSQMITLMRSGGAP